jgi:voltage-gated potassium channel
MFSSFFGIAIVALPAGIITAGYMNELNKDNAEREAAKKAEEAAEDTSGIADDAV